MMEDYKIVLGSIAVIMTIWAHIPYFFETLKGTNKPHVFTWIIWTLLTGIAFAAQLEGKAGPGAWATGITALICVIITVAAIRNGSKDITRTDWVMFLGGLLAIPLWMLTDNPVWSIWIVTLIDCSAFYPTFRKSWHRPMEENTFMYGFNIPRHTLTLAAISTVSVTTVLYPAALLLMNALMYLMLKLRRERLKASAG
jgi:hypothetical protein